MKNKSAWSKVNVVCVTYNNATTIEPLLRNLSEQWQCIEQVVIHDNGSSDETVLKVRSFLDMYPELDSVLIESTNVGFAKGIYGACRALTDSELPTLCINPDALLSVGTLPEMLKALNSDAQIGVVTAPLIREDGTLDSASVRRLPRFGSSVLYSALGNLVPRRYRYNAATIDDVIAKHAGIGPEDYFSIEATTGALMLVSPNFRSSARPIFDLSYWMYGEDLQLCKDAAGEGYRIVMVDWPPSLHLKGVSSGWPRGRTSNKAFHDALFIYYSKNMSRGRFDRMLARGAISTKFILSQAAGDFARLYSSRTRA